MHKFGVADRRPVANGHGERPRRRTHRKATLGLVALGMGLAAPVAGVASGSVNHAAKKLTPLQEGMRFYQGKTITFVSPDSPGGGFDQWSRLVAPELAIYLHATVNVESIPAGNTVAGQDAVANASPNGLTVGWLNAGPDIEDTILNLPGLNFNPLREAFLGATAPGQTAIMSLVSPSCSVWSSWAATVQNATAANPVSEVLQTTGTGTFLIIMANDAFGVHFRPLLGYASTAAQVQGFTRGDGCVTETPAATADPLVKGGKARALMLSVALQPGAAIAPDFAGVPTVSQEAQRLAKDIKTRAEKNAYAALVGVDESTRVFFTASATPGPEVQALRAAFHWAMNTSTLRAAAEAEGNPVGQETGTLAKQQYINFVVDAKKEVPALQPVLG